MLLGHSNWAIDQTRFFVFKSIGSLTRKYTYSSRNIRHSLQYMARDKCESFLSAAWLNNSWTISRPPADESLYIGNYLRGTYITNSTDVPPTGLWVVSFRFVTGFLLNPAIKSVVLRPVTRIVCFPSLWTFNFQTPAWGSFTLTTKAFRMSNNFFKPSARVNRLPANKTVTHKLEIVTALIFERKLYFLSVPTFIVIYRGPNFIIKDLPSVLILILALNDSLCCSNKYNWCLCRFIGKLYILL